MECLHRIPCHSMNLGSCASDVSHKSATILAEWNAMKHICLMISGFHEMIRQNNRRVVDYIYKKEGTYSQTICIWIREMLTVCQSELIKQKQTARKQMQFRGKVQPNARRLFMVFTTPKKGENQMKTRYFWIEILKALKINILVKRFSSNITYSEFSKIRLAGVSYSLFIEL